MRTTHTTKTRLPRTRDEVELKLLAFELTERRVALLLSVGMTIVAAICALRGSVWTVSAGTGLAAVGFRVLTVSYHHRRRSAAD
jgi:hypothetical protein